MTDALAVRSDEGEARWWLGALAVIKATAADTGGHLTVMDVTDPPGVEAPLHVHHREDEAFWVLDGDVTFEVGGKTIEASAGDFVFGPRDVPHRYKVGAAGSRMLFMLTPGGFEDLVRATSDPARSRAPPGEPSNARRRSHDGRTGRRRMCAGGLNQARGHNGGVSSAGARRTLRTTNRSADNTPTKGAACGRLDRSAAR